MTQSQPPPTTGRAVSSLKWSKRDWACWHWRGHSALLISSTALNEMINLIWIKLNNQNYYFPSLSARFTWNLNAALLVRAKNPQLVHLTPWNKMGTSTSNRRVGVKHRRNLTPIYSYSATLVTPTEKPGTFQTCDNDTQSLNSHPPLTGLTQIIVFGDSCSCPGSRSLLCEMVSKFEDFGVFFKHLGNFYFCTCAQLLPLLK